MTTRPAAADQELLSAAGADWSAVEPLVRAGMGMEDAIAVRSVLTGPDWADEPLADALGQAARLYQGGASVDALLRLTPFASNAIRSALAGVIAGTVQPSWTGGQLVELMLLEPGVNIGVLNRVLRVCSGIDDVRDLIGQVGVGQLQWAATLLDRGVPRADVSWATAHLPSTHTGLDDQIATVCTLERTGSRRVALVLLLRCKIPAHGAMAAAEALPGGYEEAIRLLLQPGFAPHEALRAACVFALAPDAPALERAEVLADAEQVLDDARGKLTRTDVRIARPATGRQDSGRTTTGHPAAGRP